MTEIRLPGGVWVYDPSKPLGPAGGFGEVFAGDGPAGGQVAVKRLNARPDGRGQRELRIAGDLIGKEFGHVVPVYDAGTDELSGGIFVAMARAECSLQTLLDDGTRFDAPDALHVLLDVLTGLDEIPTLVHRDLKPGNILLQGGVWKVADFGIAKYAEETTSQETLRGWRSPNYAAPEQWREEAPSHATDLYALGCIAHALLTGRPPFAGTRDQLRSAHLTEAPPQLPGAPAQLANLVTTLLAKLPESRPDRSRARRVLEQVASSLSAPAPREGGALGSLAEAARSAAEVQSAAEAEMQLASNRLARRNALADAANGTLAGLIRELMERLEAEAPNASRPDPFTIQLGSGRLRFLLDVRRGAIPEGRFPHWGWDVVAGAQVSVKQSSPDYVWSSSLWYARPTDEVGYRWWEVAYCSHALMMQRPRCQPFALEADQDADLAAARTVMHSVDVALGPVPVDCEDFDAFVKRWAELFAKAVSGQLRHPDRLPIPQSQW